MGEVARRWGHQLCQGLSELTGEGSVYDWSAVKGICLAALRLERVVVEWLCFVLHGTRIQVWRICNRCHFSKGM